MRNGAFLVLTLSVLSALPVAAQQADASGCKDDPLFPVRMPNYRIDRCETKAFDRFEFPMARGLKEPVEGEFILIQYAVDSRENDRSGLEVVRNYENALKSIGGQTRASDPQRWLTGSVVAGGKEAWVYVEKGNGRIWLRIVRKEAMEQIVVADAEALAGGLAANGHVTVEGIYFDTGKSDLKPESAEAIQQIAALLSGDPALSLFVVGHTDTVGSVESNLKLSQDRAQAVIQALVSQHGVAATRLRAFGNGPFAPVASNGSEEGRALNRRVELVKQ